MERYDAHDLVFCFVRLAERKHPEFPKDPVYAAAIIAEEAGELVQAANDFRHGARDAAGRSDCLERMRMEAAQTAAAAIRLLYVIEDCR
ncbi:MAG TPA: hypothetical protein DEF41_08560 [Desulfovibrio sp.]|nr:hypothetical protein [Desulfovibrio sp.]